MGGGAKLPPYLPLTLPNLELYLDGRLGLGAFADGASVTTWADQSGHSPGRDAIHQTGGTDPTMGRSGTNLTPKGAPTVAFLPAGTKAANDAAGLGSRTPFVWTPPGLRGYTFYWYGQALLKSLTGYNFVNQVAFAGDSTNAKVQFLTDSGAGLGARSNQFGLVDDRGGGNPLTFGATSGIASRWTLNALVLPPPDNNTVPARYYVNGALQPLTTGSPANWLSTVALTPTTASFAVGNTTGLNVSFRGNQGAVIWYSDTHSQATIDLFTLWAGIFLGLT